MLSPKLRKTLLTCLASLALGAAAFAQTSSELLSQAQTAYNNKEYAKSADLYMQAHRQKKSANALYNAACSFALAGEKEKAFAALDEMATLRYANADHLKEDSDLASLHGDSRWAGIVARVEENQKKYPMAVWKAPYQILPPPTDATGLEDKLNGQESGVWQDGDVLTILLNTKAEKVEMAGGIQDPMHRIPGTDLWILRARMAGWDKAIVTYAFLFEGSTTAKMNTWRGANAPTAPEEAATLQGQVIEKTYHSDALNEDRKLIIYLPPNAPTSGLPAFFVADGGVCKVWAKALEPLILAHKVRPCAIVGIENGGYRGDRSAGYDSSKDYRALEYVNGENDERFEKHLKFFADEVPAYVTKEFGISSRREDRAITGFSNGGAFSASVAYRRPEVFGWALPLSLGVPPNVDMPKNLPHMRFAAGTLETFSARTKDVYEKVKAVQPDARFDLYVAGHDPAMWELAFSKFAQEVFPA